MKWDVTYIGRDGLTVLGGQVEADHWGHAYELAVWRFGFQQEVTSRQIQVEVRLAEGERRDADPAGG